MKRTQVYPERRTPAEIEARLRAFVKGKDEVVILMRLQTDTPTLQQIHDLLWPISEFAKTQAIVKQFEAMARAFTSEDDAAIKAIIPDAQIVDVDETDGEEAGQTGSPSPQEAGQSPEASRTGQAADPSRPEPYRASQGLPEPPSPQEAP